MSSLISACGGDDGAVFPAGPTPTASASTTTASIATTRVATPPIESTTTVASVAPTTSPAAAPTSTSAPGPAAELGWAGDEVAVVETALGLARFFVTQRIPKEELDAGFPGPGYTFSWEFKGIYEHAPQGIEVYPTAGGYLGLSAGNSAQQFWATEHGLGLASRWVHSWYAWLFPHDVWFSPDGSDWELMAVDGFPSDAIVLASDPFVAAERSGTWMVVGGADVADEFASDPGADGTGPAAATTEDPPRELVPAVWTSEDLVTWDRVAFDFATSGMDTRLQSVASSERGWAVFGVRASHDAPRIAEWAGWTSADGITWEEIAMGDLLDEPPCREARPWNCARIQAAFTDQALALYAWQWDNPVYDLRAGSWTVLIAVFDE